MKTTKEFRTHSVVELKSKKVEFQKELLKLNVLVSNGSNPASPGKLGQIKKNIAIINTLIQEKEVSK